MVTPVDGVLTATFGPNRHPVLNTVRMNKGVDWAAPAGTPVVAAFDGKIVFQGDGGGYGNLVRIEHSGNRETRYAHLQRFAVAAGVGAEVKAGTVIGYVGATGAGDRTWTAFRALRGRRGGRSARRARRLRLDGRHGCRHADEPHHPCGERRQRPGEESRSRRQPAWASSSTPPGSG